MVYRVLSTSLPFPSLLSAPSFDTTHESGSLAAFCGFPLPRNRHLLHFMDGGCIKLTLFMRPHLPTATLLHPFHTTSNSSSKNWTIGCTGGRKKGIQGTRMGFKLNSPQTLSYQTCPIVTVQFLFPFTRPPDSWKALSQSNDGAAVVLEICR